MKALPHSDSLSLIGEGETRNLTRPARQREKQRRKGLILSRVLFHRPQEITIKGERKTLPAPLEPFPDRVVKRKILRLELLGGKTISPFLADEMVDHARFLISSLVIRSRFLSDPAWFQSMARKICADCDAIAYARSRETSTAEPILLWHDAEPEEQGEALANHNLESVRPYAELVAEYKRNLQAIRLYWKTSDSRKWKAGLKGETALLRKAFQVAIGKGLGNHAGKGEVSTLRRQKQDLLCHIREGVSLLENMASASPLSFPLPLIMGERYIPLSTLTPRNPELSRLAENVKRNFRTVHGKIIPAYAEKK